MRMFKAILIDDEIVAVNALKNRIDWSKYQVDQIHIANSMKQAQDIFAKERIDIMLCDIEMPNGSGLELFEWVKGFYPHVECIFVSCHPDYHYIRQAMKLGSFDYILKPVNYVELNELLDEAFKRVSQKLNYRKTEKRLEKEQIVSEINNEETLSITDETIQEIRAYIEGHLSEDICINDIAKEVHLNGIYVMRLFKHKTNTSIVEYITQLRIDKAKQLLKTSNLSVQRVAEEVGYSNYSYFTRLFKKKTTLTPVQYRGQS